MSNYELAYDPFPQDETLIHDYHFQMMALEWFNLIDEIYTGTIADEQEEKRQLLKDLLADAQEYFPHRNPRSVVHLACWEGNNLYWPNIEAGGVERGRDV